jgi:hypothetical protein
MISSSSGHWCVFYCKKGDVTNWNVMKLQRKDGVLVAAKTYDEVFTFTKYQSAFDFVKTLITEEPEPRYDAVVKRVCRARGDAFYLAGN